MQPVQFELLIAVAMQVCVNQCNQDEHYCEPMQSFSLRLDTDLVTHADYVRKVEPGDCLPLQLWPACWQGSVHEMSCVCSPS